LSHGNIIILVLSELDTVTIIQQWHVKYMCGVLKLQIFSHFTRKWHMIQAYLLMNVNRNSYFLYWTMALCSHQWP